jgi:hypothetical protein
VATKPREPNPAKATRAGKDMHSPNPKVRKEAAEVLAIMPRKSGGKKKGKH